MHVSQTASPVLVENRDQDAKTALISQHRQSDSARYNDEVDTPNPSVQEMTALERGLVRKVDLRLW